MLDLEEVNEINRRDIEGIYEYFEKNGISVERNFDLANF
jgi:serine/threonine-protein kinase RIO1